MEFKDRLLNIRKEMGIESKQEMANKLGIARTLYSMLEHGKRQPSQDVLHKLFLLTGKPEEYWLYGVTNESEYIAIRDEFKMTKIAVTRLIEAGKLTNADNLFDSIVAEKLEEHLLLTSLRADIMHMLLKLKE